MNYLGKIEFYLKEDDAHRTCYEFDSDMNLFQFVELLRVAADMLEKKAVREVNERKTRLRLVKN